MSDDILCPECGDDINEHIYVDRSGTCGRCGQCELWPSEVASAYAKKCFHEGWDACELQWAVRHSE